MITYNADLKKVFYQDIEYNIFLPKDKVEFYLNLFNASGYSALESLDNIEYYQSQKPFYTDHQISDYCLYLGTFKKLDLYSVGSWHMGYTTAIVFGNQNSDYMSGWLSLKETREEYNELFNRECACGLIDNNIALEIGNAFVDSVCQKENLNILNQLRNKRNESSKSLSSKE